MPDALPPPQTGNGNSSIAPAPHLIARAVPNRRVVAWFEDGMRLWKRAPIVWVLLALVNLIAELLLTAVPDAGALLREVISPIVASGMVYAAAAADHGEAPRMRHAVTAFFAPAGAIAAIVGANLAAFFAQAFAAWWIAGVNLLANSPDDPALSGVAIVGVVGVGVLAALPFAFVPFHVLLEGVRPRAAFAASFRGFAQNTTALILYAGAALALLGIGILTAGLGLLLALPLLATSGYAAWKDVFAVNDPAVPR